MTVKTVLLYCCVLLGCVVGKAYAVDPQFNITTPLQLANLPAAVNHYTVSCSVSAGEYGPMVGRGETSGTITGGSFRGDILVPVTMTGAFPDPAGANHYICSLHLSGVLDGRNLVFMSDASVNFPLAAGAPYTRTTAGAIP